MDHGLGQAGNVGHDLGHDLDVASLAIALLGDGVAEGVRRILAAFDALLYPLLLKLHHMLLAHLFDDVGDTRSGGC